MGEYSKALSPDERSPEIMKVALPLNHANLAISYNKNGLLYETMSKYSKVLSVYERSTEIKKGALPPTPNHHSLRTA